MAERTNTAVPGTLPDRFADLCRTHLPRPVTDRVEYENTAEVAGRLATLRTRSRDQEEYLETLTILIEKYDSEHFPESVVSDPITRLRRLMDNHGMTGSDLGLVLGNRSLGNAILRGDRKISKANAVKLGHRFKMTPAAFFQT